MHEVPRVIVALPLTEQGAAEGEAFVVAVGPGDAVTFQLAISTTRLRGFSEDRPPSVTVEAAAAVELSREIIRQLRPDLAASVRSDERTRLRVAGDEPGAA